MKDTFTLLEIIVTVVIVLILATLGMFSYQQVVDYARQKVCSVNLQALTAAAEAYALENDGFPSTLSQISPEDVKRAYASVLRKEGLGAKMAFWVLRVTSSDEAYAKFLTPTNLERYGASVEVFHCPADNDNNSYAINAHVAGKRLNQIPEGTVIIVESDNPQGVAQSISDITFRHRVSLFKPATLYSIKKKKVIRKEKDEAGDIASYFTMGSSGDNNRDQNRP